MKKVVFSLLLVLVLGCKPETKTFSGYVEGEFLYISPTTTGILQKLSVSRGQQVKEGDELFALDKTNLEAALVSAESEEARARAKLENAAQEYDRASQLSATNSISKSDVDSRTAALESAKAALEIAAQKIVQIKKQLDESSPTAPGAGNIEDTYFHAGEYVSAGTPVVCLLPPENIKIRFYVPQAKVSQFAIGDKILLHCDGCDNPLKATVVFIASQSEYTPPVIYSVESRDKLVFRIEAKPETFTPALRPGLPVDVEREAP
ncbi:MAG: efflux RND transporter periplasmic adaptor subunit [Bdellovibrionales bacterium]